VLVGLAAAGVGGGVGGGVVGVVAVVAAVVGSVVASVGGGTTDEVAALVDTPAELAWDGLATAGPELLPLEQATSRAIVSPAAKSSAPTVVGRARREARRGSVTAGESVTGIGERSPPVRACGAAPT
jgi:hypothetical protein